jgi:hypothetical protein
MEKALTERLWDYIIEYNPELMFKLQEDYRVMDYLKERVAEVLPLVEELKERNVPLYEVEEQCMLQLTKDLRPSRYCYIRTILEEDFAEITAHMRESGTLTYELLNMMEACADIFKEMQFCVANETDRMIRYAVTGRIYEYLEEQQVIG